MFSLFKKSSSTVVPESLAKQQILVDAIKKGSIPDIKSVIQNGADVNFIRSDTTYVKSPLLLALYVYSTPEVIKALIDNGANVNHKNDHGDTPLMFSLHYNSTLEVIKTLIDNGADVNHKSNYGSTPLIKASLDEEPSLNIIKLLIEKGADPNVKNNDGFNASQLTGSVMIRNFLRPLTKTESVVSEWKGGRRRKTYKRKSKKSRKTRRN